MAKSGPLIALLVVQFSFATLAVVGKDALLRGLPPVALAGLRVFFASLLLATIAVARARTHVPWTDLGRLAGLSFLGVTANILLFIEGLKRTTAVNAIILIVLIPVFTLLVAVLLRREHFDARRASGVLVALGGAMLLLRVEDFNLGDDQVVGNLFVVLNCLSYSFYLVLSRPLLQRYPSILVVAITFLLGAVVLFPLGLPRTLEAAAAGVFTQRVVLDVVWIVLVPSVLAYALNNYALKRLRASTVASFVFLQPVFGVVLALLLIPSESLDPRTALAGLVVFAGVALVVRTEAVPQAARPPPTGP